MKTKTFAILILFSFLFVSSQAFAEIDKRNVPSFSQISLRISGTLYIKQGPVQSVEINAKSSTLEKIETEVKDGKLIIKFEDNHFSWRNFESGEILIHVTVPEIERLEVSGSGDIIAEGGIKAGGLGLAVSGSGDIKLATLEASKVESSVSGSGDIFIEDGGGANSFSIAVSGSGNVKAEGFEAKNVTVKISGSGDCSVFASENLDVRVSGSGDVYYAGNPSVDSSVSGSGSVKNIR